MYTGYVKNDIKDFVNSKINTLYREYSKGYGSARGELANLRRSSDLSFTSTSGVNRVVPQAMTILFDDMPASIRNSGEYGAYSEGLGAAELACYMVLGLYARHQQSEHKNMNVRGMSLGRAVGKLQQTSNGAARQFHSLMGAKSITSYTQSLRHIVGLLKQRNIGLDYGQLAVDLYCLQGNDQSEVAHVHVRWCRDVSMPVNKTVADNEDSGVVEPDDVKVTVEENVDTISV